MRSVIQRNQASLATASTSTRDWRITQLGDMRRGLSLVVADCCTCRDRDAIPDVDSDDLPDEVSQFLRFEIDGGLFIDLSWNASLSDKGDGIGQRECGALTLAEERCVSPCRDCV